MKRIFDIFFSFTGLLLISPVLFVFMYLIYRHDKYTPFYVAPRVGKDGVVFGMVKLRTMTIDADKSGVNSTSLDDSRITSIGLKIRKYKLDEFTQLWNVLIGDMSLVGPRPNVKQDTDLYTEVEKQLLSIRPGITDFSSIVFSDEAEILEGKENPDLAYNQLIRPWKSRLGLVYIDNYTVWLDLKIIFYTVVAVISKQRALRWVVSSLKSLEVDENVIIISSRLSELIQSLPPGSDDSDCKV